MPSDFRIGVLLVGAILLLAAVLSGGISGNAIRTAVGKIARAVVGVAGAVLIVWALTSYRGSRTHSATEPAVAPAPPVTSSPVNLVGTASTALQACPIAPAPSVPDGATASAEQMAAARSAFQAYDAATNSYARCVDSAVDRIAKQSEGVASESDRQSLNTFGVGAHNTAIEQEQAIADKFNAQVRIYKAKHPKS
jgi:hypothetical protein